MHARLGVQNGEETMDYQIATGYGPSELALKVNELLDRGWTPTGGVAVEPASNGYAALYSQAMTSTKESREIAARLRDY